MSFPKKKAIQQVAKDERERIAQKVFAFESVAALIKDSATGGYNAVRVPQDYDAGNDGKPRNYLGDLRDTKACKSLLEKLHKKGFKTEWREAIEEQKDRANGRKTGMFVVGLELFIFWGNMEIRGAAPDLQQD